MPTYEYVCQSCGTHVEVYQRFNEEPLVPSKRGGPRLSPWFRVYVQASECAEDRQTAQRKEN